MAGVEKIYDYASQLNDLRAKKQEAVQAYSGLVNMLAVTKSAIKGLIARNFLRAQSETKKNAGVETLELWAANAFKDQTINYVDYFDEQKEKTMTIAEAYEHYQFLQEKEKTLSKIIESYSSDISSVQSQMRFDKPDYNG